MTPDEIRKRLQAEQIRERLSAEQGSAPTPDPAAPSVQSVVPSQRENPSSLRSFAQGLGDTASMGFGDELAGFVGSKVVDPIASKFIEGYKPDTYSESRDFARSSINDAKRNSGSFIGGQLLGALASAVATGKVVPTPSTALGRIAMAAGLGGTASGGASEADLMKGEVAELAGDVGKGVVTGAATAGALESLPAIGRGLKGFAEKRAAKGVGLTKSDAVKLGPEGFKRVGRDALDEGVIGTPLTGANETEAMLARAEALKRKGGAAMGDIYKRIDDAELSQFSPQKVIDEIKAQEGGFYSSPANRDISKQFDNILESVAMRGENLPLEQAHALKQELKKLSDFKSMAPSEKAQMARGAYGVVNKSIDQEAARASGQLGEDALGALQQAKRQYGSGASMAGTEGKVGGLEQKLAAEQTGRRLPFGLMDSVFGSTGFVVGGPVGALKGVALKKGIEVASDPVNQAWTADRLSKTLQGNPQIFGKFAGPLQDAAKRGIPQLSATNFVLQSHFPEYRDIQRNIAGVESPEGE